MGSFQIGFLTVRLLDIIDILLVAFLLYKLYSLLKGGVAINIFIGIILLYFLWWLFDRILNIQLLGTILGQFVGVGVIALIIVFQQEVRRFLLLIGSNNFITSSNIVKQVLPWKWSTTKDSILDISSIVKACKTMSKTKTGAIIVITKNSELKFYINTGDIIDAVLSKRLIESIFSKTSPLHDGAIIISQNKIKAARCVLPVTENPDLPARFGMRHRAAVGITEQSDAIVLVVSEQTGEFSLAQGGQINANLSLDELEKILEREF